MLKVCNDFYCLKKNKDFCTVQEVFWVVYLKTVLLETLHKIMKLM